MNKEIKKYEVREINTSEVMYKHCFNNEIIYLGNDLYLLDIDSLGDRDFILYEFEEDFILENSTKINDSDLTTEDIKNEIKYLKTSLENDLAIIKSLEK